MPRSVVNAINPNAAVVPATVSSSANATGLDCSGYEEVVYLVMVGAVTALTSYDVKVQESATLGGTYADITGAAITTITTATHTVHFGTRVNPAKPFQRIVQTLVGTSVVAAIAQLRVNPPLVPAAAGS